MKRFRTIFLGAAALLFGMTLIARSTANEDRPEPFKGKGILIGAGDGEVVLQGEGRFYLHGKGDIALEGSAAKDASVEGFEVVKRTPDLLVCKGEGSLNLNGKGVRLSMKGEIGTLRVIAKGQATLSGKGSYRMRGAGGDWSREGVVLKLGEVTP